MHIFAACVLPEDSFNVIWQYGACVLLLLVYSVISAGLAVAAYRWRAAVGAVPLIVLMLAAAFWSYLYAPEELVGCSSGDALRRPLASVSPPLVGLLEHRDGSREIGSEIVLGEGQNRRNCAVWLSPIRDNSENLAGRLLLAQNVGERRRMEELLLEKCATLFAVLQKATHGVLLIDQDERCLYVYPTFTVITGYSIRDLATLGAWFQEVFPDQAYRNTAIDNWEIDTQLCASGELQIRCWDGRTSSIEFRPTLLGDGRAFLGGPEIVSGCV